MARTPAPRRRRQAFLTSHMSRGSIATQLHAFKQRWLTRNRALTHPQPPAAAEQQFACLARSFWRLHRSGHFPFPSHLRVFADAMMDMGPNLVRREVQRVQPGAHIDTMTPAQRIRLRSLLESDLKAFVHSTHFKACVAARAFDWERQAPSFAANIAATEASDEPPTPPMSPAG